MDFRALRFMPPLAEFRREIRRHRAEFQASRIRKFICGYVRFEILILRTDIFVQAQTAARFWRADGDVVFIKRLAL